MKFIIKPDGTPLPENFHVDEKEYVLWESGKTTIGKFAGHEDCFILDWNVDNGLVLYCVLGSPTPDEIEAVSSSGSRFEITFTELSGCGFLALKFGSMPWGDCTFDPRVYTSPIDLPDLRQTPGIGISLNIVLVDSNAGGLIRGLRLIGLGHQFSMKFADWCESKEQERPSFSKQEHDAAIRRVQGAYSSKKLSELSLFRWHTGDSEGKERKPVSRDDHNK
jgi:hypothetical protein